MKNMTMNDSATFDTESQPRNVVWTMEGDTPLRMTLGQSLPEQVVVFEELQPAPKQTQQANQPYRRQVFLLLCLLLTSTLAYLVFSGYVKF